LLFVGVLGVGPNSKAGRLNLAGETAACIQSPGRWAERNPIAWTRLPASWPWARNKIHFA